MADDVLALGKAKFEEIYPLKASAEPTDFERIMYERLFGEIWQRPGLSTRDRRLMVIGVAAAQGNETILRLQLRSGIEKGDLEPEDLDEIVIFLTQYVGYPLGTRIAAAVREVTKG